MGDASFSDAYYYILDRYSWWSKLYNKAPPVSHIPDEWNNNLKTLTLAPPILQIHKVPGLNPAWELCCFSYSSFSPHDCGD